MKWTVARDPDTDPAHPWVVEAPGGNRRWSAHTAAAARKFAHTMASLDILLERVALHPHRHPRERLPVYGLYAIPGGDR